MNDRIARWAIESIYGPHVKVGRIEVEKRINSTRLRVAPTDDNLAALFVKRTQPGYQQGHLEPGVKHLPSIASENQNRFRASLSDPIRAPKSLLSDDVRGLLVTEYIDGRNLKSVMAKSVRPKTFDPAHFMKLAGKALASWHAMSSTLAPTIAGASLPSSDSRVASFLDFSVWNILISREEQCVYIIDFPGSKILARRHRDLATFLHSLLVIKLHPMVMVNPRPWWSWKEAYSTFLASYLEQEGLELTSADYLLLHFVT